MNDTKRVVYEKRGRVAYITLNRPDVLNAMDEAMHLELSNVLDDFESDPNLWLAILTGQGTRSFSVGQDLKELDQKNRHCIPASSFGSQGRPGYPRLTERFTRTKPIIAKVAGYAFGGGFELALACDIIVASEDATFALPEAKLGLIAGAGGVFRLTRTIPFKVAMGHLITGNPFSAVRAYDLGLINDVVPADHLDACVEMWVKDILRCAPLSVRAIKEAAEQSQHLSLEQSFKADYYWENQRRLSDDVIEGPRAFVEKRAPNWSAK